ncbi:MAG: hypothetical protein CVT95_10990, partial [Bacteroidetes bacterium HGW-Bacteroidetes-12]
MFKSDLVQTDKHSIKIWRRRKNLRFLRRANHYTNTLGHIIIATPTANKNTNMRKIILGLTFLMSITGFSQKNQIQVLSNEKILGKSLVDSSDIKGFEYIFSDRIHETFLDTTAGFLTVQLRGLSKNGKWLNNTVNIVQYGIKNQKVLWSKKIAYQSSNLQQFSNTMIYTAANKSYCLDINTGNEF